MLGPCKGGLREWLPDRVLRLAGPYIGRWARRSGDFPDWPSAVDQATGYDAQEIPDHWQT
jgi:hypothetical protein